MQDDSESPNPVESLADEFVRRTRLGERPSLTEYCERFPQYAEAIRRLFPTAMFLERVKPSPSEFQAAKLRQPASPSSTPQQLGDYLILREIGRGGMGVVYEAEQQSLGRRVALKILSGVSSQDAKHLARFDREARSAARLHHTNIVPVFGVGEHDGLHYLVMQLIAGQGLDDVLVELRRLRSGKSAPPVLEGHRDPPGAATKHQPAPNDQRGTNDQDGLAVSIAQTLKTGGFHVVPGPAIGPVDTGTAVPPPCVSPPFATSQFATPQTPSLQTGLPPNGPHAAAEIPDSKATDSTVVAPPLTAINGKHASGSHANSTYWRSVCRMGIDLARALEYAHSQGVLHRDIKPSNLLLDVHGVAWVADFGLAKSDDTGNLTLTGEFVGTLRYMAPERFQGKCDERADIYSLGLTLYELLTLEPAFGASDRGPLISQVMSARPKPIRQIDASLPADLEIVVGKAIARDPDQRYQSPGELADDLSRFLDDLPIAARRTGAAERLGRWCRRNPAIASSIGLILALLVAWGTTSSVTAYRLDQARDDAVSERRIADRRREEADRHRHDAEKQREQAQDREKESRNHLVRLNVAHGTRLLEEGDSLGSLPFFAEALRLDRGDPDREAPHRLRLKTAVQYAPRLVAAGQAPADSDSDEISPDGKLLASGSWIRSVHGSPHALVSTQLRAVATGPILRLWLDPFKEPDERDSYGSRTVHVFEIPSRRPVCLLKHDAVVIDFVFSPDSRSIATASLDGTIRIWDAHTGKLQSATNERHLHLRALTYLGDGQSLVSAGLDQTVRVWDSATGVLRNFVRLPTARIQIAIHPRGRVVVVQNYDQVRVFDLFTGGSLGEPIESGPIQVLDLIRDGREILLAGDGPFARRYDAATGRLISTTISKSGPAEWLHESGQDGQLLIAHVGRNLLVWNTESGTVINPRLGWPRVSHSVAFNSAGDRLGMIAADNTFSIWDPRSGEMLIPPLRSAAYIAEARMTSDNRYVLMRGRDRLLRLWDLGCAKVCAANVPEQILTPRWRTHSPDARFALGHGQHACTIRDTSTGKAVATLGDSATTTSFEFSGDGRFVLTGNHDGSIRLWNPETGKPASGIMTYPTTLQEARVNHDGSRVVSLADDGIVRIWDPAAPEHTISEFFAGGQRYDLYLSPDGTRAVTCQTTSHPGACRTDCLWDLRDGSIVKEFLRSERSFLVTPIVFSPDGKLWLSTNSGELIVRETETGKLIANCGPSPALALAARFVGSAQVVTGSVDGVLRIWDLDKSRLAREFPGHHGPVGWVAASPNGRYLFSAGGDQTGRLWDAATGELVALLRHSEFLSSGWFSPDSSTLITVARYGAVLRWNLAVDDRPVDDWAAIADLLAGKAMGVGADNARNDRAGAAATWERLRAAYPEEFTISAADEENWSRQSAEAPQTASP